jgi:hypothetical protein
MESSVSMVKGRHLTPDLTRREELREGSGLADASMLIPLVLNELLDKDKTPVIRPFDKIAGFDNYRGASTK